MVSITNDLIKPNKLYNPDSNLLPFEQLNEHLKEFVYYPISNSLIMEIESLIDVFLFQLMECKNVSLSDRSNIHINITGSFVMTPKNLITACLLYGYYVPTFIIGNRIEMELPNGDVIYYDNEQYILIKKYVIQNLFSKFTI